MDQRQGLFQAMVEDVLEAATCCDRIDEVIVVTKDVTVTELARRYSARVIPEPAQSGLIPAVTHAAKLLRAEGVKAMVFLPGDVPLVTVEELEIVRFSSVSLVHPIRIRRPQLEVNGSSSTPSPEYNFGSKAGTRRPHFMNRSGYRWIT